MKNKDFDEECYKEADRLRIIELENSIDNEYLKNIDINASLLYELVSKMPSDLTKLEKTIYVYLKMCTLLTYDEEYYAMNQSSQVNAKHEDIKNLINIDVHNNQVVCYEFNMIFAKILDMFDCPLKIKAIDESDELFGKTHASLTYVCDDFVIDADSVTSILNGDLQLVKRNILPVGLTCKNVSGDKQSKFSIAVEDILYLINSQNIKKKNNFHKNLELYHSLTNNKSILPSLNERIEMLLTTLFKANLDGIDAIGYIKILTKKMFCDIENNIDMTILNETVDNKLKSVVVFTVNNENISKKESNFYLCFNPPNGLTQYSFAEMKELFDKGIYLIRNKMLPGFMVEDRGKNSVR